MKSTKRSAFLATRDEALVLMSMEGMEVLGGRALSWFLVRISTILLVVGVPLTLLSVVSLRSVEGEIHVKALERLSLKDLALRQVVVKAMVAFRESYLLQREPLKIAASQVRRAFYDVDTQGIHRPNQAFSSTAWQAVHQLWAKTRVHPDAKSIDRLIDLTENAINASAFDSELSNDGDRAVRNLTSIMMLEAPQFLIDIHRLGDNVILVLQHRSLNFRERVNSAVILTQTKAIRQNIVDDLSIAGRNDGWLASETALSVKKIDKSITPYVDIVEAIIVKEGDGDRTEQRKIVEQNETIALAGVDELIHRCEDQIILTLGRMESKARLNRVTTQVGLVLLWCIAIYLVVRITEPLKQRAQEMAEHEKAEQARQNVLKSLALKKQMYEAVFERAPVGIAIIDGGGDITDCNPALKNFLDNKLVNLIGDYAQQYNNLVHRRVSSLIFERKFEGMNGAELWAKLQVSPYEDEGSRALCMVQDITEVRQSEARLLHEATHDGLTGLANRRLFRSTLGEVLKACRISKENFAVLFIDLDLFKYVNDTFGHAAGDFVLGIVAQRLKKLTDAADLVARFGGDEFAVLVAPPCRYDRGERLALAITESVAEPILWEGHQVNIGSSIGLIYGPGPYELAEEMMRNADTAMYAAKTDGRGRFEVFDPAMQEKAHQDAQLSNDLQSALNDPEQIHVLYHPIVSLKDNAIMGFEALARWRHPLIGDIETAEFVKIAEQSGAIRQLGRSVMLKAFRQLTAAGKVNQDLSLLWLSVNLSSSELSAPDFVESVAAAIRETDFDPSRLYLEITESRVIDKGEQANRILSRLREFGIRVSIDDFGAGYSSLRYLQEINLDMIKIDKGFLKPTDKPESRRAILLAILGLAKAFRLPVCVEGVETNEQLRLVQSLGFEYAQGRVWGLPMTIEEIGMRFASGGKYVEQDANNERSS